MCFYLLGKAVGQAREPAHPHAHRESSLGAGNVALLVVDEAPDFVTPNESEADALHPLVEVARARFVGVRQELGNRIDRDSNHPRVRSKGIPSTNMEKIWTD